MVGPAAAVLDGCKKVSTISGCLSYSTDTKSIR